MWKIVIPAAAVVAILAATNPNEHAHSRAMVDHARDACADHPLKRVLCAGITSIATAGLRYDDYMVYSTAELGDMHTYGLLGKVVVVGSDLD